MPKKSDEALQKHTFNLYAGDMEQLQMILNSLPPERKVKASEFMRKVLREYLERIRKKVPSEGEDLEL